MIEAKPPDRDNLLFRISRMIRENRSFAVFSHQEPDGDAIGSQVAVTAALKGLGKEVASLRVDPAPPALEFLNRDGLIRSYSPDRDDPAIERAGAVIVVDCCDYFRLGRLAGPAKAAGGKVVNIDHHRDNAFFGDVNYVRYEAGGTAELVFEVLKSLAVPISGTIADALYVGLSTDTVGFRYIDPEGNLLEVVRELIKGGIDVEDLQERIYCNQPDSYLEDLAALLRTVRYEEDGGLAWFTMFDSDSLTFYQRELASEALKQLLSIRRVRAAVMLHREAAGVEVWLRSKKDVNVNRAAGKVGGGGHHTAAGALVRDKSLEEATKAVLAAVREEMR